MSYIAMWLPADKYGVKSPYTMTPAGIVVHNTANDASAINEITYMNRNNNQVSYHVAIDDINIVQAIPFTRNAWHAGATYANRNMIGIEICYSRSGGSRFDKAERAAARYIATLCKQYGWGIDKVQTHQKQNGKYCPHRTLDLGWQHFLDMVQANLTGTEQVPPTTPPTTSTSGYTGDSIVAYLNSIGVDSSQANRRKLAVQYGVANYDLSTKKNLELLAKMRNGNKVSSTPAPSPTTPSGYVVGRAYTTQVSALNVRTGAGANFAKKSKSQLSADGRKNSNASGQLNKGVKVTCQQVAKDSAGNPWIRIPSGWICAVWKGSSYVS